MSDYTGGRNIAEYDWCYTFITDCTGRCEDDDAHCDCISRMLHAPHPDVLREFDDWGGDPVEGQSACGIGRSLSIAGMFDRMGADRCPECCNLFGFPPGVGSPKNDQACRDVLGMPPSPGVEKLMRRSKAGES